LRTKQSVATIDLIAVPEADKAALWRMLQRYLAELSAFDRSQPADSAFPYHHFNKYWQEAGRWPFWIISEGKIAGFALVRRTEDGTTEMAEFCIEPAFRHTAIGTAAARALFAHFPGRWQLSELKRNLPAIAFWRHVLRDYADFEERIGDDTVEQQFSAR
jgi:predicted acetyltransferase